MGTEFPASDLTLGQTNALVKKLGGMDVVSKILTNAVKVTIETIKEPFLRLISGAEQIMLAATDGTATIAESKDVFTAGIDADFQSWGTNVAGKATSATAVAVHEVAKDGNFSQLFGSLGNDLDKLRFEQGQIIQFVKDHKKWLQADGYATLFLFKVGTEFFVAIVGVFSGGRLVVLVRRFSDDCVWGAGPRRRIVVPQL